MVRCASSPRPRGQRAPASQATAASSAVTSQKRIARYVKGSAYGRPYLAPMNPVDQRNTKSPGMTASQAERARDTTEPRVPPAPRLAATLSARYSLAQSFPRSYQREDGDVHWPMS